MEYNEILKIVVNKVQEIRFSIPEFEEFENILGEEFEFSDIGDSGLENMDFVKEWSKEKKNIFCLWMSLYGIEEGWLIDEIGKQR